jgi:homoserine O-acetyltransferase
MELSVLRSPPPVQAPPLFRSSGAAEPVGAYVRLDVEVTLPVELRHLGKSIRASATGNPAGPVIVVLGGISGNRFVCTGPGGGPGWWPGLVGRGRAVDPARHLVVGLDFAADASGKCAPSTEEQARVLAAALDAVGAARADAIVGASYGGMVALAFAELFPDRVRKLVVISAGAAPHPAASAARELQRRVVALGIQSGRGEEALAIARGMAMLTYRTSEEFAERFTGGIDETCPLTASAAGAYLRSRGRDFLAVMSPERFLSLSASIDRHCIDPAKIGCPALLIGAQSDQLVPPAQMKALASELTGPAELHLLPCLYGHDMFLKEAEAVGRLVKPFLDG